MIDEPRGTFGYEEGDDRIGIVTFDQPGAKVNTLGRTTLDDLARLLDDLERRSDLHGLIWRSGKPGQFIAGADLKEIAELGSLSPEQARAVCQRGHDLFGRISRLPYPTVAAINGPTMGGGLEMALAMDGRLAALHPKTELALPEVKIGIIPAWGGTQRLPRLIGVPNAIEMIGSGEGVTAGRAAQLGLVFDAVPEDRLMDEARRLIDWLRTGGAWQAQRRRREQPVGLGADEMEFSFATAEALLKAKTKGHYPAPLVALRAIRLGCNRTLEDGLKIEIDCALEVLGSAVSRNLIAVFFLNQRLARGATDSIPASPRPIDRAGVLGAGLMGSGIAAVLARRGLPVVLLDVSTEAVAAGMRRAREVVESRIRISRATADDLADLLMRLTPTTRFDLFRDRPYVIEAVTEDRAVKMALYRRLAEFLPADAILASNTSTISITALAEAAAAAERFVGMHFFYPVDRMQLVEVIRGARTDDRTVATTVALARRIGKSPIVVQDCAGFLVNRILFPYMDEALLLAQEGTPIEAIDRAATRFGMPMGPITLFDVVGLDTALYAGRVVHAAYPDRAVETPLLDALVQAGRRGQKSGAGFQKYDGPKGRGRPDPEFAAILARHRTGQRAASDQEITERLFLAMLLEAVRTLSEGIVREPADVDAGLILGIGFPPFRGGILRWADSLGAARVVAMAAQYRHLGPRFEPPPMLQDMARSGGRFYE